MTQIEERKELVESLIQKIRLEGFQIVNRRYGKFVPAPQPVGGHDIDILAKRSGSFIIGLCIASGDFSDSGLEEKVRYLASRTTKYSNTPVKLYIAIDQSVYVRLAKILQNLPHELRHRIRAYPLTNAETPDLFFNIQKPAHSRNYFN
ncbi:MAG: hypothetical protein HY965_06745 [Ignavibacteriales bacterium]|nr:hypothetical protein [Ignavibacteriales bacterium]